ncbi:MAG TPA: (Fe-S)-binding protein [Bacilli bacterium]|nr:(Fe-S)-binding protein [Bacilli bacterium]
MLISNLSPWLHALIALGVFLGVGLLLGLLLAFADEKLAVKKDERTEKLASLLPGLNCGLCGYPSCNAMSEAILAGKVKKISQCRPSRPAQREAILEYLAGAPDADGKTIDIKL